MSAINQDVFTRARMTQGGIVSTTVPRQIEQSGLSKSSQELSSNSRHIEIVTSACLESSLSSPWRWRITTNGRETVL
jgi:hypothetical protein